MRVRSRPKVVLLGIMSRNPFAGVVWQTLHYAIGLERLGFDVYYVEAHGITASNFMAEPTDDGTVGAANFIDSVMRRFGFANRWAYHARFDSERCYGLSWTALQTLYESAEIVINLHGATIPLPEHSATGRLVYLETDPVDVQIELYWQRADTIAFLEPHCAFFTFGENYGRPDCKLPVSSRFHFRPTRQPVVMDFWKNSSPAGDTFTTVGNWKQTHRDLHFKGEVYRWSKHHEFLKFVDLPTRVGPMFELALSGLGDDDRRLLESHGWRVAEALPLSSNHDTYQRYITGSRAEFTVAKDQNIRLRSGWFSDRSATYLAAGRPVVTQDTGFGNVLPTGGGLFAFTNVEEIVDAVERVNADYARHSRAAADIAQEYFGHDVVLRQLLDDLGISVPDAAKTPISGLPHDLILVPVSRKPVQLPLSTIATALARSIPSAGSLASTAEPMNRPFASIVIVTYNNLVYNKLCLETLLANTAAPDYEVVIVDNGSTDGTAGYLRELADRHGHLSLILNDVNRGFAAANNQALARASGDVLVLLNNDTIVPPGWLLRLVRHLTDSEIGLVGPVTNRICNEAQIDAPYQTYGEMLRFADEHVLAHDGEIFDIRMLAMFCTAMRREVFEKVGPLDERYEVGMLEDEDYSIRVRNAGYRVVCAEDVFVHHFGEASFGALVATGEYHALYERNRRRFEAKWGVAWTPYRQRRSEQYRHTTDRIRSIVRTLLPEDATVAVVSRGDDELLELEGRKAWHFPQTPDGTYAGYYPSTSADAVAQVEAVRAKGAQFLLFPEPALWWLSHYGELKHHLEQNYHTMTSGEDPCLVVALQPAARATNRG